MFHKGEVLNFRMINDTRKRLYDLGIFERVNIDMTPIEQNDKKYFRADIDVEEFKPYRLRYGIQYDTETSFGVLASLVNRNFLGNADLLGTSLRLNRDERDARAFFRSPYFFSKKINTELFMFYNRTIKSAFTLDRIGFTLQQQIKIKKSSMISYNYSFEKIDTLYPVFEGLQNMDSTDRLGTLNVAFTRDTRDDILDATRGMFLAQSLRYAPGFLGSKTKFIRYFGQYNTYQKLSDFLTYAASIRVGLGKGLSRDLPTSERFYAGGGTTIRGFKKDELGPRDTSSDLPLGGNGVFILNQEFRFPIFKKLRGVVFLDLGNVYPKISDIDFFDVRKTAGFGFRLHTPFVLIRFDWGFKLDRRPGETLSLIFFSIGQAF
jgi:outer membrane protein assembly complex protein YaeT